MIVQDFLRKVNEQETLKRKLDKITSMEDIIDIAREAGYEFSIAELQEAIVQITAEQSNHEEFSDEDIKNLLNETIKV